ncbi:MAG: hypothetical protein ABWK01_04540 [Infirmifilum sp.]
MQEVYAYFKPPQVQTMREHVEKALEVYPEDSKLVQVGLKLSGRFYHMLKLAIVLHDYGKTPYNTANIEAIRQGREFSFPGHEIISGVVTYLTLQSDEAREQLGLYTQQEIGALTLAVFLHHHPMGLKARRERLSEAVKVTAEEVNLFASSIAGLPEKYLGFSTRALSDALTKAIRTQDLNGVSMQSLAAQIFTSLRESIWLYPDPSTRKLFLLLLQGLVTADYCSARLRGSETLSTFSNAVKRFAELYGGRCV